MRIWMFTHRLPFAPNRGDRLRAFHILDYLGRRAEVHLLSLVHDADELAAVEQVRSRVASVHAFRVPAFRNRVRASMRLLTQDPMTLLLLHSPEMKRALPDLVRRQRPDVVLAYCSSMAIYAMGTPLSRVPMVLDMVDADSQKWHSLAEVSVGLKRLIYQREARRLRVFERQAMRAASVTTAVNDREVGALREISPDATVITVENGISLDQFAPSHAPAESATVVFCGVMNYAPNEDAALRLIQRIWPKVLAHRADARLVLVGMNPTSRLCATAANNPSVHVTGAVEDVRPYLWQSAVAAVPITVARGVQNKVLESLAAGLPTVVSPVVSAGLPAAVRSGTAEAESDEEFAAIIVRWLAESPLVRRARAESAELRSLGWENQLRPLWGALQHTASHAG